MSSDEIERVRQSGDKIEIQWAIDTLFKILNTIVKEASSENRYLNKKEVDELTNYKRSIYSLQNELLSYVE